MKALQLILLALVAIASPALAQVEAKLKPTQRIHVRISGVPAEDITQISQPYTISQSGEIPLVYLGRLQVVGLSPSELAQKIERAYVSAQIYTRPTVVVSMSDDEAPDRRVTVNGEVRAPVRAIYQDGMTLLDAIASAGGFTDFAKVRGVRLMRNGKTTEHDFTMISQHPERDIALQPDDKIIVPHR